MAGSVWYLPNEAEEAVVVSGGADQDRFDAAKAVLATKPGLMQLGPGTEAVLFGSGMDKVAFARIWTQFGVTYMALTALRIADQLDPTKMLFFDVSGISAGVTRTAIAPNYTGRLVVAGNEGTLGQFLKSMGAGVPPEFADVVVQNALLDGSNHSDTAAAPVARGALIIGNSLSQWARLVLGPANTMLLSDGTDANWGNINLLSAFHADTLAAAVQAGDILIGNATPKWARLAKGADGEVLQLVAGLPAWGSVPAGSHDTLAHVATFTVANCKLTNSSAVVTTSGSGFSAARAGDRVYFGATPTTHTSILGALIQSVDSDTQITLNMTYTGSTTGFDQTATVVPYDHDGHLILVGSGSPVDDHMGLQQLWGNLEWRGGSKSPGGVSTAKFLVQGGSIPNQPNGFGITNDFGAQTAYFDASQLTTGAKIFRFPTLAGGANGTSFAVCGSLNAPQELPDTRLTTLSKIKMDGTATYTVFMDAANLDRLAFDLTAMSALRAVSWPDLPGRAVVRNAEGNHTGQTAAIGSTTLATAPPAGVYRISAVGRNVVGGSGTAVLSVSWNDGAAQNQTLLTIDFTSAIPQQSTYVIYVASGNVTYSVAYTGGGTETYDVRIRMEAI